MKANYRIVFHNGPNSSGHKNVDVCAESFEDARAQAYKMPEARNGQFSDMMIEQIPDEPIVGIEFAFEMKNPPFYQKGKDYLFIKAHNEAEAVRYYNDHFRGKTYGRNAGENDDNGKCMRGKIISTYFSCGMKYCADATLGSRGNSLSEKIAGAEAQKCATLEKGSRERELDQR